MTAQQCLIETANPDQTPELRDVFDFTITPVTYSLRGFQTIRRLIMQGTIFAMREPRITGEFAEYNSRSRTPTIRIGFDILGTDPDERESKKGLLLHECIHAMQDNRGATWMRVDLAEAAAYTAQCLFHRACGRDRIELDPLVEAAWDVTDVILGSSSRVAGEGDLAGLLAEIRRHPSYASTQGITGRYDGIERPEQPPRRQSGGCGGCAVSALSSRSGAAHIFNLLSM